MLVQWQEGGPEASSWEDVSTICDQFPKFNLEDKVIPAVVDNYKWGIRIGFGIHTGERDLRIIAVCCYGTRLL